MTDYEAVSSLDNRVAGRLSVALLEMKEQNIPYFISEARRPLLTQCLYALQGIDVIPFCDLEWACREAGIRPPGKNRITWTLKSNHYFGLAVDIVPLKEEVDPKDSTKKRLVPDWNNQDDRIVKIMRSNGFVWGGDFPTPDKPHFEMRL